MNISINKKNQVMAGLLVTFLTLAPGALAEEKVSLTKIPAGWKVDDNIQQSETSKSYRHSRNSPRRTFQMSYWKTDYDYYAKGPFKKYKTGAVVNGDMKILSGWEKTTLLGRDAYPYSAADPMPGGEGVDYYRTYFLKTDTKSRSYDITYHVVYSNDKKIVPKKLDMKDFQKFVDNLVLAEQ